MLSPAAVHAKAADLGKLAVRMTTLAGSGHPSSALSLAHVVTHLMYNHMRYEPANPWHPTADRLVLSEGHAVPIVYAAYADLGGAIGRNPENARPLRRADVDGLRAVDSELDGHPNPAEGFPFFDAATGSLGMGLSVAAGLALAARLDGSPRRVYCIIGDGESREGQIWEAADFIIDHRLNSVCAVFNCNGQGQAADVSPQQSLDRLAAKLTAFGWEVAQIDGHDPAQIAAIFERADRSVRPFAIVARTIKGWGVDALQEGNWHGKPVAENDLPAADAALDKALVRLGIKEPAPVVKPPAPGSSKVHRPDPRNVAWPPFADAMASAGMGSALEKGKLATRRAYGAALKVAGDLLPQIAVVDGDVSNSTFANVFAVAHPERFFECKIAEQNMVSVAAGLAAAGWIPFANSFGKFLARAYDQIELANISRANIKLVGSHSGISLAADGPSQMSVADVAFFRSLSAVRGDDRSSPLCWMFQPADAVAAYRCTRLMVETRGMCYMRTHRPDVPLIYGPAAKFELGGLNVVSPGADLAIVTAGFMVHVAKDAIALLERQNIRAALIDAYCLPMDAERLLAAIKKSGGKALIVEDNYPGLSAAVTEITALDGGLRVAGMSCNRIPKSARTEDEILSYCGVSARHIADHANALLHRS